MSVTNRGTNKGSSETSPKATAVACYDNSNPQTAPLAFYVGSFDGQAFGEVKYEIPNMNKDFESKYMRKLRELYELPEDIDTAKLLTFLRSLVDYDKNNTVELVDERLQELSEQQYIGTLEALKGSITKGSLSVNIKLDQLKKGLTSFGATKDAAELLEKVITIHQGAAFGSSAWNKIEMYEISNSTVILTVLFLRGNYSSLKATTSKVLRFFQTIIVGELLAAKIIICPVGREQLRQDYSVLGSSFTKGAESEANGQAIA